MKSSSQITTYDIIIFLIIFLLSSTVTIALFFYLNDVQPFYYVDEVFHIPQTISYCKKEYFVWNPKITTLPGLYLITSTLLAPFNLCETIWIRCTNLIGIFVNLYLILNITFCLHKEDIKKSRKNWWIQIASSYNITFLPPLFFFFFLHYTDIFSVTMVLALFLSHLKGRYTTAAVFGMLAVLIRQTNIIWVFFFTADYLLDVIDSKSKQVFSSRLYEKNGINTYLKRLWSYGILQIRQGPFEIYKFFIGLCRPVWGYVLCGLLFTAFIVWNKGIVVGDHSAHMVTIHLPQMFYFSVFTFTFSWPYMLPYWKDCLKSSQRHWILTSCILICLAIIIHKNTIVHPYVLADNRHYVFYAWNKCLKYKLFRFLLIPVYYFAIYAFLVCISHLKASTRIVYLFCVSVVLIPQLLLEPRYFLIPYIIFRLHLKQLQPWQIVMESITMVIINFMQFFIFVHKTFYWQDLEYPQRIGW